LLHHSIYENSFYLQKYILILNLSIQEPKSVENKLAAGVYLEGSFCFLNKKLMKNNRVYQDNPINLPQNLLAAITMIYSTDSFYLI